MIDEYLSKMPIDYKNIINTKSLNDNKFNFFINNCAKLNINIINENGTINTKQNLNQQLEHIKSSYMKNFGIKVFKQYSEDLDDGMNKLNNHYKKLLLKMELIENINFYLNSYDDNNYIKLFEKDENKKNSIKIDYSEDVFNTNDVIDFSPSLFVTSDEYDSDQLLKPLKCNLRSTDPFLAEYSN